MGVNRKITGTSMELPGGLLKGAAVGMALTVAGAAGMSVLIVSEVLRETAVGYCAMGILMISSYVGAMVAIKCVKSGKLVVSLLSGLFYYGVLLGVNAVCFRGDYTGAGVTALVVAAGAGAALLMALRAPKRRNAWHRKNKRR